MNIYRNKKTGQIIEMASEFGSDAVWEKVSAPQKAVIKAEEVKEDVKEVKTPTKKTTTRKAVKK